MTSLIAPPALAAGTASHGGLSSGAGNIAIGLLVLAWLIGSQLRRKQLGQRTRLGLILATIGLIETVTFAKHHHLTGKDIALTLVSIAIGVGLAVLRANTVRIWSEQGTAWQQGTWVTALLWVAGLGQHLLVDLSVAKGFGQVTLLLYFGVVIFAQRLVIIGRARAQGLLAAGSAGRRG